MQYSKYIFINKNYKREIYLKYITYIFISYLVKSVVNICIIG